MSTLQVANINFESTANNVLVYAPGGVGNTVQLNAGGVTIVTANSTTLLLGVPLSTTSFSGNLTVTGSANVSSNTNLLASANVSGNLNVTGSANVATNLNVTGSANVATNLNVTGNVAVTGYTTLTANVSVTGSVNVGGAMNVGTLLEIANSGGNIIATPAAITVANSTATVTTANYTGLYTSGTINSASYTVGATFTANSTLVNTAAINVLGQANVVNVYATGHINVGAVFQANTTQLTYNTNTFNLGASNNGTANASNGYTYLTNGLKMVWGSTAAANSTGQVIVFNTATGSGAFSINCFGVYATPTNNGASYTASVTTMNTTAFTVKTGNATNSNVMWMAIGM